MTERHTDHYGIVESVEIENVQFLTKRFSKELEFFMDSFNLLAEIIFDIKHEISKSKGSVLSRDLAILMVSSKFLLSSKALLNLFFKWLRI